MPKFHVVIDTNIYRKNPSRSDLPFEAIERLCKKGIVKLHLPYIVEREFQTQQVIQYKKDLDSAIGGLDAILRKELSTEQVGRIQAIRDELNAATPGIFSYVETVLPTWVNSIGGQRHAITEPQAVAAMESYFRGMPPFTTPKVREDIPDSFIYQTILELSKSAKPLVVISEDGKIAKASEALPEVIVYRSLDAFIESKVIQAELLELDVFANLPALREVIEQYEADANSISDLIKHNSADRLYGKTVYSDSIPDDNHEARITGCDEPENIELDFNEVCYFGAGKFGMPFTFTANVSITYYIFKADFYLMDEDKMPSVSDHNDHYYEAEEEIEINVSGLVRLIIVAAELKSISAETLEDHLKISIDSIDSIKVNE